uniref:C-type lectin domain-containing protein n=1 Tax=Acrobeloides nanus TaxID=290746 RepID=A0A914CSQ8_9BILA
MKENKVSEALIGLSLKDDQINWKWDDNSEVDYINWNKNEPNNVMSSEYLVEMLKHGRWNDVPNEHNRVAICQILCEDNILPSEDPNKWKKYDPEDQEEAKLLLGEILVVNQTEN